MAFVPVYIVILGFTSIVDYFAGIFIEKTQGKKKKWFLVASLCGNIGVLAFFKYYNFLNENLTVLLQGINFQNPIPYLSIILPIGLSFHTFQAMSYTIEVYRGNQKAERHFGIYALYVMFFPQLVAGPIERPQNMLHQYHERHYFDIDRFTEGLKMMLWGFFKKVVIADRLAFYVDPVYNNPTAHSGSTFILATIFFAFQIYCDFSGYSDIAIGCAHILGFKLMQNFRLPYLADSVRSFWQRWHISLTSWFRDYVFFPLTISISWKITKKKVLFIRSDRFIYLIAMSVIWILTGIWHGANWTFVIWGAINGFYLIFGVFTKDLRKKFTKITGIDKLKRINNISGIIITFLLICIPWIFFRAKDVDTAWYILSRIFTQPVSKLFLGASQWITLLSILLVLFLIGVEILQSRKWVSLYFSETRLRQSLRWAGYIFLLITISILGVGGSSFIYFQF
ncbi:MAG: MBOAT family protein [Bacteroidales bacterium]|jgi:D-alanyl-lipoteichoic acid acyltransferase DltB (MBOAT superfamily)|nr:MBOAT family protein [Bacteroidales bacterium]